jgi:hypothetical protein
MLAAIKVVTRGPWPDTIVEAGRNEAATVPEGRRAIGEGRILPVTDRIRGDGTIPDFAEGCQPRSENHFFERLAQDRVDTFKNTVASRRRAKNQLNFIKATKNTKARSHNDGVLEFAPGLNLRRRVAFPPIYRPTVSPTRQRGIWIRNFVVEGPSPFSGSFSGARQIEVAHDPFPAKYDL